MTAQGTAGAAMWLPILALVLGPALFIGAVLLWRRGTARLAATRGWTQSVATIEASSIDRSRNQSSDHHTYRPQVAYRYSAGGVERRGSKPFLLLRPDWNHYHEAQAWLAKHPVGAQVPVWYDPANPDDAALELNKPSMVLIGIMIFGGVLLTLVGLFMRSVAASMP